MVAVASCDSSSRTVETPAEDAGITVVEVRDATVEAAPPRPEEILSEFETRYSGPPGRNKNIERALFAEAVVLPGAVFSLNEKVGPRTEENGFVKAPVIFKGELTDGVGGGVCQVSSTVHAAARMAGMEIVERTSHSRPSAYIPVGLDSTVVWPRLDLKIRNPFPCDVKIRMDSRPSEKKGEKGVKILRARVWCGMPVTPPPKYTFDSRKKDEFERVIRRPDGGAPAAMANVQKGRNGAEVFSTLTWADGAALKWKSVYPPTNEIWEVGTDVAEDLEGWIPPPPDAGAPRDAGRD
jgi:hypothetical protein